MLNIRVETYSGHKADERPVRFWIGARLVEVRSIADQWYSPDVTYFRIYGDDGKLYVLRHNVGQDQWSVEVLEDLETQNVKK